MLLILLLIFFLLLVVQYDVKARRTFLKKTRYEAVATEQLRPGNTVVVYGRQLRVLDYADAFTRSCLEQQQQRCACVRACNQSCCPRMHALPTQYKSLDGCEQAQQSAAPMQAYGLVGLHILVIFWNRRTLPVHALC